MKVFLGLPRLQNQFFDQSYAQLEADQDLHIISAPTFLGNEFEDHPISSHPRFTLISTLIGKPFRQYVSGLIRLLFRLDFDLADVKMLHHIESLAVLLVAKLRGKPAVGAMLGGERHLRVPPYLTWRYRLALKMVHAALDVVICNDRTLVATSEFLSPSKPRVLLFNCLNIDRFTIPTARPDRTPTIFFNHRVLKVKRADLFLKAAAVLRDEGLRFRILVVGPKRTNTAVGADLQRLISELELGDVIEWIDRRVSGDEIIELYSRSDVSVNVAELVVPSLASLEALACGLPLVAAKELDSELYVEPGKNGYLCEATPQSIAQALKPLIQDHALRQRMGMAARDRVVKRFSLDKWANRYVRVYQHVLFGTTLPEDDQWHDSEMEFGCALTESVHS